MKRNMYLWFTIAWIGVIFSFSLQSGDVSGALSGGLGRWLLDKVLWLVGLSAESLTQETLEMLHFLLRKCCHFGEFFVLGILAYQAFRRMKRTEQFTDLRKAAIAFVFSVGIATMDECLQLFVDGRAGRVADVLLDSSGALVGIVIFWAIARLVAAKHKREL